MTLINCPDCGRKISPRANFCPHCGCPAQYFGETSTSLSQSVTANIISAPVLPHVDPPQLAELETGCGVTELSIYLSDFDRDYRSLFLSSHYIAQKELKQLHNTFDHIASQLSTPGAPPEGADIATVKDFLAKLSNIDKDALAHNNRFVSDKVAENKEYFDGVLSGIDSGVVLDDEQRRAIVTEDDYVLLIAGAGAGKTTTMAAKVKYLVDKRGVKPEDIVVISYTNKAIGELRERINKGLGIPAKISTFHAFAYEIIRTYSDTPPVVSYKSYYYIVNLLENAIYDNKKLMRNLVLFLGYYFDLSEDVLDFENLNQYHLFKAQQYYETIKSSLGEYLQKVIDKRRYNKKAPRTITGEYLRSMQEVQIANFLYLNGLDYEYEPQYPHKIPGSGKLYTPDFIIRQDGHEVYLEHYALSDNGYNTQFTQTEIAKYKKSIQKKRLHHAINGTKLLETWSFYKDRQPLLVHLREKLIEEGFVLKERDPAEVYKKLVATGKDKYIYKLTQFMMTFISQYKVTGLGADGFKLLREKTDNPRTHLFLDIAVEVYQNYQEQLRLHNQIDFEDMINDANNYLEAFKRHCIELPYKYIIIDEFQDIARQRFDLTKRLSEITQAKVVAVGDDWQSIYAFAGSDITLFTKFLELMGSGVEMQITHTYRNSQELIDIAGGFIQKNATQIQKRLISPKSLPEPIVLEEFDDSVKPFVNLARAVERIIGKLLSEYGTTQKILLLGRYNFDGYKLTNTNHFEQISKKGDVIQCKKYPQARLTFMTAHSSKGLGFDNVVILNMFEGKFGFPSQIENDPIMRLVSREDQSIPYAEERRLFYVALTRTKNRVYIATPQKKASRFLVELIKDYDLAHSNKLNMGFVDLFPHRCPICGFPLKYEINKNYGLPLYLCTNAPEVCDFMTNHPRHKYDIFPCNMAGCDGYMIVRIKNDKPFYGCTNYSGENGCHNTLPIKTY